MENISRNKVIKFIETEAKTVVLQGTQEVVFCRTAVFLYKNPPVELYGGRKIDVVF